MALRVKWQFMDRAVTHTIVYGPQLRSGPYNILWVTSRSINFHMALSAMNYLLIDCFTSLILSNMLYLSVIDSVILTRGFIFWGVGAVWCLTPLCTILQLYHGGPFYWWKNRSTRRKPPTCRKSLTNFFFNILSSTSRH